MLVHNPRRENSPFKDTELKEDETAVRIIEDNSKEIFTIRCTDPFGFWKIQAKKGKIPRRLEGVWTTSKDAERAIESYLSAAKPKTINQKHRESLGLK